MTEYVNFSECYFGVAIVDHPGHCCGRFSRGGYPADVAAHIMLL